MDPKVITYHKPSFGHPVASTVAAGPPLTSLDGAVSWEVVAEKWRLRVASGIHTHDTALQRLLRTALEGGVGKRMSPEANNHPQLCVRH